MIYISLFLSAFFAATIFPAQSELVLLYLLQDRSNSVIFLLLVATVGNVLGAVVNYGLGYYVHRFKDRRWFPASPQQLEKAQRAYARWGRCHQGVWLFPAGKPVGLGQLRQLLNRKVGWVDRPDLLRVAFLLSNLSHLIHFREAVQDLEEVVVAKDQLNQGPDP